MKTSTAARYRKRTVAAPAGAIADVAFLLLIFFLVTTQIAQEKGITTQLPPYELQPPPPMADRNVLRILISAEGQILADGERLPREELRSRIRDFILNPEGAAHLASAPNKAVISLQHDRSTRYGDYLAVYDAILSAYRSIWEARAQAQYGTSYEGLGAARQKQIRAAVPLVISEAEPSDVKR